MAVGFSIDVKQCVGCNACVVACQIENKTARGVSYRKVIRAEGGDVNNPTLKTYSVACNHCTNPACKEACPAGAISVDGSGRVLITQATCVGCRRCEWACPYGAPQFNSGTTKVEKCTHCQHNTGRGPACAATCLTGTLTTSTAAATGYSKDVAGVFPDSGLTNPNTLWRDGWSSE